MHPPIFWENICEIGSQLLRSTSEMNSIAQIWHAPNEKQAEINTNLGVTEAEFMAHGQHSQSSSSCSCYCMFSFVEELLAP